MYPLSATVFIRNNSVGFCLYESIASLLHLTSEFLIMDLGSDDGTFETLQEISRANPKIKLVSGEFPKRPDGTVDASAFAVLANDIIKMCQFDNVLYYQSDEIWHEDLLPLMEQQFQEGHFDLAFWRIQYKQNFQYVKWFPHLVHRVGYKGTDIKFNEDKNNFEFNGDGMNTTRSWDAKICSHYGGEYFPKWGEMGQEGIKPYVNEMITDISLIGAFRDTIPARRKLHVPFWHEEPTIPDKNGIHRKESDWMNEALNDPDWTKGHSPYNIPKILRYHVGKTKYELRPELLEALKNDTTRNFLGI